MYWYSDDISIDFNFNRQKSGLNKVFYGHRSSSVFLTNILKYRLDRQLTQAFPLSQAKFLSVKIRKTNRAPNCFI